METIFHLHNGETANSVEELYDKLQQASEETIEYHLQRTPNDFSKWVRSMHQEQLADTLESCTTKGQILSAFEVEPTEENIPVEQKNEEIDLSIEIQQQIQETPTDASADTAFYKRKTTQEFLLGMLTGAVIAIILYRALIGI